ncbi:MAG TPA: hypothetical protein VGD10_04295 [Allosphingosinicella sp.]
MAATRNREDRRAILGCAIMAGVLALLGFNTIGTQPSGVTAHQQSAVR